MQAVNTLPRYLYGGGSYMWSAVSGVIGAGSGAIEICQARWISSTKFFVLRRVSLSLFRGTTAFTAGQYFISMTIARGWSADGTGGTAQVFSTNNTNKKRTSFSLSAFSDTGVRISTTAGLGAGTKQLDTNAMVVIGGLISSGATTVPDDELLSQAFDIYRCLPGEFPILLTQNEGIVIQTNFPATGTYSCSVLMEWDEVPVGGL
jgi:hypothetical protein